MSTYPTTFDESHSALLIVDQGHIGAFYNENAGH